MQATGLAQYGEGHVRGNSMSISSPPQRKESEKLINDKGETQYYELSETDMKQIRTGLIAEGFSPFQASCVKAKEYTAMNGNRIITLEIHLKSQFAFSPGEMESEELVSIGHAFATQFLDFAIGRFKSQHIAGKVIMTEDEYTQLRHAHA